jgi:hypothetical protein
MSSAMVKQKPPQQLIIKGLLKHMRPIQAIVFMGLYEQFPARFLPNNDFFFRPSMKLIIAPMKIKEPVYHLMMSRLVEGGWLERRKAKAGGLEYRIVFDKLHPFIAGTAT